MSEDKKEIGATKGIPMTLEVGVYYWMDDDGSVHFDEEEMVGEFFAKLAGIKSEWEEFRKEQKKTS